MTKELSLPQVNDCLALHLGVLHSLTLPLPKLPTFLFKTLAKFLQQLTGTRGLSRSGKQSTFRDTEQLPDNLLISPPNSLLASTLFGSTSSIGSIPEPQTHLFRFVSDYRLVEEFEWLREGILSLSLSLSLCQLYPVFITFSGNAKSFRMYLFWHVLLFCVLLLDALALVTTFYRRGLFQTPLLDYTPGLTLAV
ncbi:unnamed protein product [Dibothriocephalus latus]|uniref:Uncharacterized protein n=1 Tax=Dibothriocephalus latus TaxID=60516 RepID=A0A3P7N2I8_DIBLA|nr:unnamed protein product [Dibothriocephalus latus]